MKIKRKPPLVRIDLSQGEKSAKQRKLRIELTTYDLPDDKDIGIGVYAFEGDEMVWHGMLCVECDTERFVKLFGKYLPIILEHKRVVHRGSQEGDAKASKASKASQEKKDRTARKSGKRSVGIRKSRS